MEKKLLDYQTSFDNPDLDESELIALIEVPKNGGEWLYEKYQISPRFRRVLYYSCGNDQEKFNLVSECIADPDDDFAFIGEIEFYSEM